MSSTIEIVPMDVADLSRILQEYESELEDMPSSQAASQVSDTAAAGTDHHAN